MTMGERLKMLREKKKLTQFELANELHVGRDTINKWEGGRDINTTYLAVLADFFDVSCDYIVRGKSYENTDAMKRTGLSDEAVDVLHSLLEAERTDAIWFADLICCNFSFLLTCSESFRLYINYNLSGLHKEEQKQKHAEIMECVNAADYQQYRCEKYFSHLLSSVWEKTLLNQRESSRYNKNP